MDHLAVQSVELREIGLQLREPFRISSGMVHDRRILLVRMCDSDGTVAWSECVAGEHPNYSAETVDTAWAALRDWFIPRLLAEPLRTAADAHGLLRRNLRGHRMAGAALEMAVWAMFARRRGMPLAALLGGSRKSVEVGISIGIQETAEAAAERVRAGASAGYRRMKLKIEPGSDIEYVAAVRDAAGPAVPLMVDANNAYTLADAHHLMQLDAYDLLMIEQPLAHDDIRRHAELQRMLQTPLCLDESITSVAHAEDMIALRAGRIINIKPGRVGGFAESLAIHDLCAQHDVPVWCGGMLESGIGRAYNVALASLPNFTMPGDISPSARYWQQDVVTPEWRMSEPGFIDVPTGPGIGVDVDVGYIDDLTVKREVIRRSS